jgi:ElaB/YqjD/DUF883 family membrane-anchored ribosome-binding protein
MDSRNSGDRNWDVTPMPQAATTGNEAGTVMPGGSVPPVAPALRDQAADIGRKATEGARHLASQAQSTAQERIERGKHDAANTLTSVATTLLQSGMQLRDGEQPMAGEYIERAARQIERVAQYVEKAEFRDMVDQVEDFARKRPAVFIGSAFAAGLLAARFLKNSRSSEQRAAERDFTPRYADREVPPTVSREPGAGSNPLDPGMEPL